MRMALQGCMEEDGWGGWGVLKMLGNSGSDFP